MRILSIQTGHNASVALFEDDAITWLLHQEKFDNVKNSSLFPRQAIEHIISKISDKRIDRIAICGVNIFDGHLNLNKPAHGSAPSSENVRVNKPSFSESLKEALYLLLFKTSYPTLLSIRYASAARRNKRTHRRLVALLERLSLRCPIEFVSHHECHAFSPVVFYGLDKTQTRDGKDPVLVLTIDGAGDRNCATISRWDGKRMERLSATPYDHSLGYIYAKTTRYLGMKELEHEYKVMGLAAYTQPKYFAPVQKQVFDDLITIDPKTLQFKCKIPAHKFDAYLRKHVVYERFDNIAGALQQFSQDLALRWITMAMQRYNISRIAVCGGFFMNVKINQKIVELPQVKQAYFMPSAGDESNVVGALGSVAYRLGLPIKPMKSMYYGLSYTNEEIEAYVKEKRLADRFEIRRLDDPEETLATLLAQDIIVARFAGRGEWGARSLCNRAILGNASTLETFHQVNDLIKMRDFWMPFAPTILESWGERYIKHWSLFEKKVKDSMRYMIVTCDSTALAQKHLRAGIHQKDKTLRPQVVGAQDNPQLHRLLTLFEKKTGMGGILNTSLNIHGYPLVGSLDQLFFTMDNSGLTHAVVENFLFVKKPNKR